MRRRRRSALRAGRPTIALAAVAGATFTAVIAGEFFRVWHRGRAPLLAETDDALQAAAEAVAETAEVARAGYREVSDRENALFVLLSSFVTTFVAARTITTILRSRPKAGPFRNLTVGRRHVHHFVPGIAIAFIAGAVSIISRDERLEPLLAVPFGAGMGLTLDESALLLELDDVYWSEEGILSVQITLAVTALLASVALATRLLRRGEAVVLAGDAQPAG